MLTGTSLADLGDGEWDIAQLRSLIGATLNGSASVDAYELDFLRKGQPAAFLVLNAQLLDYSGPEPLLILTITDMTDARSEAKAREDLIQEKDILLKELQHRVANSLQIIASVLLQSARRVESEETRSHLRNAHHRVISIATLQKQLTVSSEDTIHLREYFTGLCDSIGASMIDDEGRITLRSTCDNSTANASKSTSLGLIVTELVINALKHAFPESDRPGEIVVDYHGTGGNSFILSVSDNGVGIAASDAPTAPGLGTGIVDALSRHLGAGVETIDNCPGTRVAIVRAA